MQRPARDEPTDAPRQPGLSGLVGPPALHEQSLPPAGWRPLPVTRRRSWRPTRAEVVAGVAVVLGLALAGLAVGAAWELLAPRMPFRVVAGGQAVALRPESEDLVAADAWFAILTLGVGAVAAAAVWLRRSARGPLAVLALAVGGMLGAIIAWQFGGWLGPGPSEADLRDVGSTVYAALDLRATSALIVEPFAAVVLYLLFVGFAADNELGVRNGNTGRDLPPY